MEPDNVFRSGLTSAMQRTFSAADRLVATVRLTPAPTGNAALCNSARVQAWETSTMWRTRDVADHHVVEGRHTPAGARKIATMSESLLLMLDSPSHDEEHLKRSVLPNFRSGTPLTIREGLSLSTSRAWIQVYPRKGNVVGCKVAEVKGRYTPATQGTRCWTTRLTHLTRPTPARPGSPESLLSALTVSRITPAHAGNGCPDE